MHPIKGGKKYSYSVASTETVIRSRLMGHGLYRDFLLLTFVFHISFCDDQIPKFHCFFRTFFGECHRREHNLLRQPRATTFFNGAKKKVIENVDFQNLLPILITFLTVLISLRHLNPHFAQYYVTQTIIIRLVMNYLLFSLKRFHCSRTQASLSFVCSAPK